MIRSAFRISRWMGGHILTSSSSILSSSYVLLAPRSRDYIKVNNYRWQSGDINGRSNNTNNSITARSYGDKSGRGQKKTLKADDRSDYLDLVKKLPFMNNSDIASNMQRGSKAEHRFYGEDLMKIVQKLASLDDSMRMIPLSQLVNSLSIYDDKDEAVVHLIEVITKKVRKSEVIGSRQHASSTVKKRRTRSMATMETIRTNFTSFGWFMRSAWS